LDDESGLSQVLPIDVAGNLARYYRHVTNLFASQHVDAAVAHFAELALEEGGFEEAAEKDLWVKLFKAHAGMARWEEAYAALMATPFADSFAFPSSVSATSCSSMLSLGTGEAAACRTSFQSCAKVER
jgi:hypothetical protein